MALALTMALASCVSAPMYVSPRGTSYWYDGATLPWPESELECEVDSFEAELLAATSFDERAVDDVLAHARVAVVDGIIDCGGTRAVGCFEVDWDFVAISAGTDLSTLSHELLHLIHWRLYKLLDHKHTLPEWRAADRLYCSVSEAQWNESP